MTTEPSKAPNPAIPINAQRADFIAAGKGLMGHIGLYKHSYLLNAFFYINFQMQ